MIRLPRNALHYKLPIIARYVSTSARDSQTMRLPDGRTLGFSECGRPDDHPLIYMHGYPASRLETLGMNKIANRHNVRIITPDRNGYGLTTFNSKLRILDWPADIRALAGHLGLERFAVLGGSGGSPFALACAHLLPHEMLSGVGIMAGAGPWEAGARYMSFPYLVSAAMAHYWPSAYGAFLNLMGWSLMIVLSSESGANRIDKWLNERTGTLGSENEAKERTNIIARQVLEEFRQGSVPAVHEAQLLTSNWGINFEDVTYNKVKIWHGSQDRNAPVEMMRYMAERLPHCELHEFEDDTHFTLHRHMDQILTELVPVHSRAKRK